jgi:hypothetical protein
LLSFDSTTLTFTVTLASILTTTSYNIEVLGSLASPGGSAFITFNLYLKACDDTIITSTLIADQTFYYDEASETFSMTAFTESLGTCGAFTYTIT